MKNIAQETFGLNMKSSYLELPPELYTMQKAISVKDPNLLLLNETLANDLGLNAEKLRTREGAELLSGNRSVEGVPSFAQAYSGHQFGHFTQLGDGRALVLGEHLTREGKTLDIQLKGSGPTPYSRRGDGRAGLSPMLREYLISEAMAHLGIPSTRSLAVVHTGESVYREHPQEGAILTRVASSHIRVGTFQYAATKSLQALDALYRYTIKRHYPNCSHEDNGPECLLFDFAERQAKLIAKWQSVGFIHGVMNTDNVSLAGETMDYGPCAFMDRYDPNTVFSSIDTGGRYRYANQPLIGKWNLARFAEALMPLIKGDGVKIGNLALAHYDEIYEREWLRIMRLKLGLFTENQGDRNLIEGLLNCMVQDRMDFNDTFLKLTLGEVEALLTEGSQTFADWYQLWSTRRQQQDENNTEQVSLMKRVNPSIVPRNHLVEHALYDWVTNGNEKPYMHLLSLLETPYAYTETHIETGAPNKDWPEYYRTTCGT